MMMKIGSQDVGDDQVMQLTSLVGETLIAELQDPIWDRRDCVNQFITSLIQSSRSRSLDWMRDVMQQKSLINNDLHNDVCCTE